MGAQKGGRERDKVIPGTTCRSAEISFLFCHGKKGGKKRGVFNLMLWGRGRNF